jgi:ABC-type nitrate/sulfonate/bicarbonate transport system permease component
MSWALRLSRLIRMLWPPVLPAVVLIAGWQLVARYGVRNPQVPPSPGQAVSAGWQQRAALERNAWPTLRETELGFAFSFAVSWILATAMDFSSAARRAVYPLLVASQTIPIVAIAPLFVVVFGFGIAPKVLLVALATAIGGAIFAEYAGAESGLGIYLQQMQQVFRTDLVFATVAVIAVCSIALFALTYLLERWLTPWRKHERAGREAA